MARPAAGAETVIDALRRGGTTKDAAALLGISYGAFRNRCERVGVSSKDVLRSLVKEAGTPPPTGGELVTEAETTYVRISLADYAVLRAQADAGDRADYARLQRELEDANRIIEALTQKLEDMGSGRERTTTETRARAS